MTKTKWILIDDTHIQQCHANGGRSQVVLFKNEKGEQFKINILSESYEFQSYATLSKWTEEKGFAIIVRKNPKKDYGIDISYRDQYSPTSFEAIIRDLQKIAENF